MPRVEVTSSPRPAPPGKPSATTVSPRSTLEPRPSGAAESPPPPPTRSSATSSHRAHAPTAASRPPTRKRSPALITCPAVTTSPSRASSTHPEPVALRCEPRLASTSTVEGATLRTTAGTWSSSPPPPPVSSSTATAISATAAAPSAAHVARRAPRVARPTTDHEGGGASPPSDAGRRASTAISTPPTTSSSPPASSASATRRPSTNVPLADPRSTTRTPPAGCACSSACRRDARSSRRTRSQPWTRPRMNGRSSGSSTVRPASAPDRTLSHTSSYGDRVGAQELAQLHLQLQRGERRGERLVGVGAGDLARARLLVAHHEQHLRLARHRIGAQLVEHVARRQRGRVPVEHHQIRPAVADRLQQVVALARLLDLAAVADRHLDDRLRALVEPGQQHPRAPLGVGHDRRRGVARQLPPDRGRHVGRIAAGGHAAPRHRVG